MWDPSDESAQRGRWYSSPRLLLSLLGVCVFIIAYLLWNPEIRSIAFAPLRTLPWSPVVAATLEPTESQVSVTSTALVTETAQADASDATATIPATAAPVVPSLDQMAADLQAMQETLAAMATPLAVQVLAPAIAPQPWTGGIADAGQTGTALTDAEVAAAVAEIDRLYAIMQPLMVQLQSAAAGDRSASEQAALRAQMTDLHAQLNELIARVQTSKLGIETVAGTLSGVAAPPEVVVGDMNALPTPTLGEIESMLAGLQVEVQALLADPFGAPLLPQANLQPALPTSYPPVWPAPVTTTDTARIETMLGTISNILATMEPTSAAAP